MQATGMARINRVKISWLRDTQFDAPQIGRGLQALRRPIQRMAEI